MIVFIWFYRIRIIFKLIFLLIDWTPTGTNTPRLSETGNNSDSRVIKLTKTPRIKASPPQEAVQSHLQVTK